MTLPLIIIVSLAVAVLGPAVLWRAALSDAVLRQLNLAVIYRIDGGGIGDILCISAIMRAIARRADVQFIVITKYPELFATNPRVRFNVDFKRFGWLRKPVVKVLLRHVAGHRVHDANHRPGGASMEPLRVQDKTSPRHLAQLLSIHLRLDADFTDLRCEMVLPPAEVAKALQKHALPPRYAVIISGGKTTFTANREWTRAGFQGVVSMMPETTWVQVGTADNSPLTGVVNLCGKTTLREVAAIIAGATYVVTTEGLYNHLASATGTTAFVIMSGFSSPALATYPTTIFILRQPQPACSPCWKTEPCPVPGKPCTDLTAAEVIAFIRNHIPHP